MIRAYFTRATAVLALTLLVLLAHLLLLGGMPRALWATSTIVAETASRHPFNTRSIAPSPATERPFTSPPPASHASPVAPSPQRLPPPISEVVVSAAPESESPTTQQTVNDAASSVLAEPPPAESSPSASAEQTPATAESSTPQGEADSSDDIEAEARRPRHYLLPDSVRIKYKVQGEVKGFPYFVSGELLWLQRDGDAYEARMEISHFLLGSRVQTSRGNITPKGLAPVRFGDKVRSEVAAHFERSKGKIIFSANTPDAPLRPGAQDQLSVFIQLAALLAGNIEELHKGDTIPFQVIGPRSAERWVFTVGTSDLLDLPGGTVKTIQLSREPVGEHDPRVEVWLAKEMGFIPVRIRLSQSNGDFIEQQWLSSQKP